MWYNRIYAHIMQCEDKQEKEWCLEQAKLAAYRSGCAIIRTGDLGSVCFAHVFVPTVTEQNGYIERYERWHTCKGLPTKGRYTLHLPMPDIPEKGYVSLYVLNDNTGDLLIMVNHGRKREVQAIDRNIYTSFQDKITEILDYQLCNGWQMVDPEDYPALTGALMLTDDVLCDSHGNILDYGRVFWYSQYEIKNEVHELATRGYVILQGVYTQKEAVSL